MIEVNLVPEDRRPVERTPLPRFLMIIVGVIGFCVEGILLVMILADSPRQKLKLKEVEHRINAASEKLAKMKSIKSRITQMKTRNKSIGDLYRFRRTWAPLLHRLSSPEVLPTNIWYSEIELKQGRAARSKTPAEELFLRGYARGTSDDDGVNSMYQATQAISNFVANLQSQGEEFTGEFNLPPVKDKATEVEELSVPKEASPSVPRHAAAFGIKLVLKVKKASDSGKKKN
jgi:Tfp pilus assembly protein PilN